ncbi:MAG TPA: NAD(P)/FAD-dependent oxidoreductase [Actinokineospora sp.]|nr:NAD(P)/FAD-dependent oxidoreductase [Actinokineospora sp.]
MDHYDVVIVGARPAGAATGMLLARAGLRVLIVDRSRRGADTLSTHALMRGGVLQLSRWGLLGAVTAAGTPPVRHATFHTESGSTMVPIKSAHGVDALYAPRRTVLDPIIADAAAGAGATLRYGVTAKALRRDDRGRVIGIVGHDRDGSPVTIGARHTIGADGMGSRVAHWTGAATDRQGATLGTTAYCYLDAESSGGYEWFFRNHAAAGAIPTNDGQTCVFVATPQPRFRRELIHDPVAGFRRLLTATAPELADRLAGAPSGPPRRFPGRHGHLRRASGPGWALVGDAGYFKDPITAHGITDALRDAELLARAIITDTLPGYQATRDRLSLPLFTVTDAIAGYAWDEEEVTTLLKQLSAAMAEEIEAILAGSRCTDETHSRP